MYLACKIPGVKSVENVVEKKCSLSLTDFSKAGLLEDKDVFNVKITGEYTVYNALRELSCCTCYRIREKPRRYTTGWSFCGDDARWQVY